MNVMIMTDLEGISGVDTMEMIQADNPEGYRYACRRLMADINAAVEGCLDAGADDIWVVDGHGGGKNFIHEMLHPKAKYADHSIWQGLIQDGKIDAYMEVGCHAMPGTFNGFLDHCQSSKSWFSYVVNGRPMGEIGQGAIFCGAHGVPFVMVTGDDAACQEARALLGDIPTASVKKGVGRNRAALEPLDVAEARIRAAACEALRRLNTFKPYHFILPLEIKLTLYRTDMADSVFEHCTGLERLDARTVRKVVPKVYRYQDVLFAD
ncbi:MAG: aminopeptidase [Ruminococcaceae bacterium]|nr:aminopeptidase [Oscillospiraceae bacterium]